MYTALPPLAPTYSSVEPATASAQPNSDAALAEGEVRFDMRVAVGMKD